MTTPSELNYNQKIENQTFSLLAPLLSSSPQASGQLFKDIKKPRKTHSSEGSTQTSTGVSSFNEKTPDMVQGQDQLDGVSESSTPASNHLFQHENSSVPQKICKQTETKKKTKVRKNTPQKKKNVNFRKEKSSKNGKKPRKEKSKVKKGSSKNAKKSRKAKSEVPKDSPTSTKGSQSEYKNSYNTPYRDCLNFIQEAQLKKICPEAIKPKDLYNEDTESKCTSSQPKNGKSVESYEEISKWYQENQVELSKLIVKQRFVKFLPFEVLIQDSNGLINETDCRKCFEEFKNLKLDKLKEEENEGEGKERERRRKERECKLLTWIFLLAFSLVWVGEQDHLEYLTLKQDTVALFYWIIHSKAESHSKCLFLTTKHRKHIKGYFETKFLDLFNSAWNQFPNRYSWLFSLASADPYILKLIPKSVISSKAWSKVRSPFPPVEQHEQHGMQEENKEYEVQEDREQHGIQEEDEEYEEYEVQEERGQHGTCEEHKEQEEYEVQEEIEQHEEHEEYEVQEERGQHGMQEEHKEQEEYEVQEEHEQHEEHEEYEVQEERGQHGMQEEHEQHQDHQDHEQNEVLPQQQVTFLNQFKKITYDYKKIWTQELIPMILFEALENVYFQHEEALNAIMDVNGALKHRIDEGWSQNEGYRLDQLNPVSGWYELKLRQILTSRFALELNADSVVPTKKVKKG